MPRQTMPMDEVLLWLLQNQPDLEVEVDRNWVWVTTDISHERYAEVRDSIASIGFIYAPEGHDLPSGALSYWSHSCTCPTRFRRRGGKQENHNNQPPAVDDNELLALLE